MQKLLFFFFNLLMVGNISGQQSLHNRELSINGFRNPSVGLEYRHHHLSAHAGYYPTALVAGENTSFVKAGLTFWLLPVGQKEIPSSFYVGGSYLRGFSRDYNGKNALGVEAGFRWMIWKGLNFRIGALALVSKDKTLKINPTPGISYSFPIH